MLKASLLCVPVLLVSLTAAARAGEAKSEGVTVAPMPFADATRWYEEHRRHIFKAANAEIIETRGDGQYVLRTQTPMGPCTYRVKETVETGNNKTVYRVKLLKSLNGAVADQSMTVTLTGKGESTQIALSLYVNVAKRLAPSFAIKSITDQSIRQTIQYVKQHGR